MERRLFLANVTMPPVALDFRDAVGRIEAVASRRRNSNAAAESFSRPPSIAIHLHAHHDDQAAAPHPATAEKSLSPSMIARDFEATDFALYLMLKDTRSAAALAQSLGAPAYMVSGATRAFARAEAEGLGDKDFSAVAG